MASPTPRPVDHTEAVALFRLSVIGSLVGRDFDHGQLRAEIAALSLQRWRPPGSDVSRTYSVPTLQRWYYAYRLDGLDALRPKHRADRGRGRALTAQQQALLLNIRRAHPSVSAPTIIHTLVTEGRLEPGQLAPSTLNRLYAQNGLRRQRRDAPSKEPRQRRRWQVEAPGVLWHSDVCHGPDLRGPDQSIVPVRIHALLDDASRYVVALEVHAREREVEMLGMLARAVDRVGAPKRLYLDNGPTYVGQGLATVCGRLGVAVVHARPYDPEARGKMERFWRTMREQCLDFIAPQATPHDVTVRLNAWLDTRYHVGPHAGLLGRTPQRVWEAADKNLARPTAEQMRAAFSVRQRRRVRKDGTLDVDGVTYELDAGFLAGKLVDLVSCLPPLDVDHRPQVEHEDRVWTLHPVDPVRNASRQRAPATPAAPAPPTDFNPAQTHLDQATGRGRTSTSSKDNP